jgi:hypothetical protein
MSTRPDTSETSARERLLERQRAILGHLADPKAFESGHTSHAEALAGIDAERLRTLGRLILAKRLAKIEALLPATCRCIRLHVPALLQAFASACPAASLGRWDNAGQLHDFILAYEGDPPAPRYLADLVRLEYLAAAATFAARDHVPAPPQAQPDSIRSGPAPRAKAFEVRVPPEVELLETGFDLREALGDSPPPELERGHPRLVAIVSAADKARVFWLQDEVAGVLLDLGDWTPIQEHAGVGSVIESLAAEGLVEIRPCDFA